MVFHGDYEVEFEIYEKREGPFGAELLGHMVGISLRDAEARWAEAHSWESGPDVHIFAQHPKEEWE